MTQEDTAHHPDITIVGPTASGKTSLAIDIATQYDAEVICADSRTIYRDLDIGTAKPTLEERRGIMHWGLDIVTPGQRYSAAAFQQYAYDVARDAHARGKQVVMVGGTGLYVDAVLLEYAFPPAASQSRITELDALTIEQLQKYCFDNNIIAPKNNKNKRHLIHAIVTNGQTISKKSAPISKNIVVGIKTDREVLRQRITQRASTIFSSNVVKEAMEVSRRYSIPVSELPGSIYKIIAQYQSGELSLDQARELFVASDMALAKRQMTWFKRHDYIYWGDASQLKKYIAQKFCVE